MCVATAVCILCLNWKGRGGGGAFWDVHIVHQYEFNVPSVCSIWYLHVISFLWKDESSRWMKDVKDLYDKIRAAADEARRKEELYKQLVRRVWVYGDVMQEACMSDCSIGTCARLQQCYSGQHHKASIALPVVLCSLMSPISATGLNVTDSKALSCTYTIKRGTGLISWHRRSWHLCIHKSIYIGLVLICSSM